MNTHTDRIEGSKNQSVANAVGQSQSDSESAVQIADNRPEANAQRRLQDMANNSPQVKKIAQLQAIADNHNIQGQQPLQMMMWRPSKPQPPPEKGSPKAIIMAVEKVLRERNLTPTTNNLKSTPSQDWAATRYLIFEVDTADEGRFSVTCHIHYDQKNNAIQGNSFITDVGEFPTPRELLQYYPMTVV